MAAPQGSVRGLKGTSSVSNRPNIVPAIPLPLVKPRATPVPRTTPNPPAVARAVGGASTTPRRSPAPTPTTTGSHNTTNGSHGPILNDEPAEAPVGIVAPLAAGSEPPTPSAAASRDPSKESATPPPAAPAKKQPPTPPNPDDSTTGRRADTETVVPANPAEHMANLSFAGRTPVHQPHPSNGSFVMFGGFHDSNTASPAPLSAGGTAYPPPSAMPPLPDRPPVVGMDSFGLSMLASPTADGFPPAQGHHGTSTPHSFHGSQASYHAEENGHVPYPPGNGPSSSYMPRPIPPTPYSASLDPRLMPVLPVASTADPLDNKTHEDAIFNLQSAFADAEFADCVFEVRLPHSQTEEVGERREGGREAQPSLRIPAHRVVLARSPTLKRRLHTSGTPTDGTLLVYGDDRYLRADALYYAIRTLYGSPLGPVLPTYLPVQDVKTQFELALGYAAAGRFLQLDLVLYKGVRTASRLVTWDTVEKAFEYTLPGYICPYTSSPADSSPTRPRTPDVWATAVRELLNGAVTFVVHHFPRDFMLDSDPCTPAFGRLPSAFQSLPSPNSPPIARGTSIPGSATHSRQTSSSTASAPQMPPSRALRNPNLASIKFGDLSTPASNGSSEPPSPPRIQPTAADTLFSRILLHLPFHLLKEILEDNSLASLSGGVTLPVRHKVMLNLVQERESRRIRAVESLRRQTGPLYHYYKARVSSLEAQPVDGDSDYKANNLSLKEQVTQPTPDGPCLAQSWQRYDFPTGAGG